MKKHGMGVMIVVLDAAGADRLNEVTNRLIEGYFGRPLSNAEVKQTLLADPMVSSNIKASVSKNEAILSQRKWYRIIDTPSKNCPVKAGGILMVLTPVRQDGMVAVGFLSEVEAGFVSVTLMDSADIQKGAADVTQ